MRAVELGENGVKDMGKLLQKLRYEQGLSLRHAAWNAGVSPSVFYRAERGRDAKLSTWAKLFVGIGCVLMVDYLQLEDATDIYREEQGQRNENRRLKYRGKL